MSCPAPTVLIAEDNPGLARVLAFKFERAGFKPIVCSDGQQAWETFQRVSVDAIVTDQEMPHTSGLELIGEVRGIESDVPCFLVTGRQLELARDSRVQELGVIHVFGKPFSPAKVVAAVERSIAGKTQGSDDSRQPKQPILGETLLPMAWMSGTLPETGIDQ